MDPSNRTLRCPLCGRAAIWTDNPSRPFCSE
ncbi:MAG: DNA gyrase inhibitor YacG, partial [Candidatus Entotheonellia bacterium]